jgi:hypothetical protein
MRHPPRPRCAHRCQARAFVNTGEANITFETSKPFDIVGGGLILWIFAVVNYPASLVLDFFVRGTCS